MSSNTSLIVVIVAAIALTATAVPAAIVASNDDGYVEMTFYGYDGGFGPYMGNCMKILTEAGAKDARAVTPERPNTVQFVCKIPTSWTFEYIDDLLYYQHGSEINDYYPRFDDRQGELFENHPENVHAGVVAYMDNSG